MPQATEKAQNGRDQQIAANGLSTPQDAIAILLHRLVRRPGHPSTPLDSPIANERRR
jgi:hypothetical protein